MELNFVYNILLLCVPKLSSKLAHENELAWCPKKIRLFISYIRSQKSLASMVQSLGLGRRLGRHRDGSVSAADSAGTETDRSRRLGSDSGDTQKTLHRALKKL